MALYHQTYVKILSADFTACGLPRNPTPLTHCVYNKYTEYDNNGGTDDDDDDDDDDRQ